MDISKNMTFKQKWYKAAIFKIKMLAANIISTSNRLMNLKPYTRLKKCVKMLWNKAKYLTLTFSMSRPRIRAVCQRLSNSQAI